MKILWKFFLIFLSFALPASASTYYVSSSSGSDINAGTKASPWAHAPGMTGCSLNCLTYQTTGPQPGDNILFKGGENYQPISWAWGGSNGSPIYLGVDQTWYTGTNSGTVTTNGTEVTWQSGSAFQMNGSWAGGAITINGVGYTISSIPNPRIIILTTSAGVQSSAVAYSNSLFTRPILNANYAGGGDIGYSGDISYITLDSFEMTGDLMITGNEESFYADPGTNLLSKNLYIHGWLHCTANATPKPACTGAAADGQGGGIYFNLGQNTSNGNNNTVTQSNIGSPEDGGQSGVCTRAVQIVTYNFLHDCTGAVLHGGQLIHDNIVVNAGNDYTGCASEHGNVFYMDDFDQVGNPITNLTVYVYNNHVINPGNCAQAAVYYPNPGTSGVTGNITYYMWNNVLDNQNGSNINIIADNIDPYNAPGGQTIAVYDWNNTYDLGATPLVCVNVVTGTGRSIQPNIVDVRNLQCVAGTTPTLFNSGGTTSPASSNLLATTEAQANADGYSTPQWLPTTSCTGAYCPQGGGITRASFCSGALVTVCESTALGGEVSPVARPATPDIGAGQYVAAASTPSCDHASGFYTLPINVACSVTGGAPVLCWRIGAAPSTNGGSGCGASSTLYVGAVTINSPSLFEIVAGGSGFSDGPVATYNYNNATSPNNAPPALLLEFGKLTAIPDLRLFNQ